MKKTENSYNRFLSGDDEALDEIIRDYIDGLIFYLYSIIGDIQKAEDFAIDTLRSVNYICHFSIFKKEIQALRYEQQTEKSK